MPGSSSKDEEAQDHVKSPLEGMTYPFCAQEDVKYETLVKIGQGTFGEVFKARCKKTQRIVALKKVLMDSESEGFPITALREIKILQKVSHKNVVELLDICCSEASAQNGYKSLFYLVLEFCEHDLAGLLKNRTVIFNVPVIKDVMRQLMNSLYYLHWNKILHRDMKASNILITKQGVLKLADFGLARAFGSRPSRYTNRVVTLWYRPPELLLGDRKYSTAIDMWGAGCIMAEMWTRNPIMPGDTEQKQLTLITQLCGSITKESWPGVDQLELFNSIELPQGNKRRLKEWLRRFITDTHAVNLVDRLLTLDPAQRINADDAMAHEFFFAEPDPQPLTNILSRLGTSMFDYLPPPPPHRQQPQQQPSRYAPYQKPNKKPTAH